MIWENYVFRRGAAVEDLWDELFEEYRAAGIERKVLYIGGKGFDVRSLSVLRSFVSRLVSSQCSLSNSSMVLIGFSGYELSDELRELTAKNVKELESEFSKIGDSDELIIQASNSDEDDHSANSELRRAAENILSRIDGHTDIVLDISSLPRIVSLTILLSLLAYLRPNIDTPDGLVADGISLHVLVGEDAALDGKITAEDPSNDLVLIPGYAAPMQTEASQDSLLVWFPILGENRQAQVSKIEFAIPQDAEICPIVPHPSKNPRRGDNLLADYDDVLIRKRDIPLSNVIYAHESHPFEVYRQLLKAMKRYRETMQIIGGCRLVVTPLASKLMTIGAALACYEMKEISGAEAAGGGISPVAIPYAEPKRYVANVDDLDTSRPEIAAMILTGEAYAY